MKREQSVAQRMHPLYLTRQIRNFDPPAYPKQPISAKPEPDH